MCRAGRDGDHSNDKPYLRDVTYRERSLSWTNCSLILLSFRHKVYIMDFHSALHALDKTQ